MSASTEARGSARAVVELPRRLGPIGAAGVLISIMIGSGIFRVASVVARNVPTPSGFMLIWVVGGLLALAGALSFGELASMYPTTGGRYVFLREGISPLAAFVYAWAQTFLLHPVGLGAGALVLAGYLGTLIPPLAPYERLTAAAVVVLLSLMNVRSVRLSAGVAVLTGATKAAALAAVAVLIVIFAHYRPIGPDTAAGSAHAFGLALVTVMWTYSGWATTTYISGEVRRAESVMPRVLAGGVIACTLLFLLINFSYLRALPMPAMAASKAVAADAAGAVFGPTGRTLIAVLVVVSIFSSLNGTVLASPRMSFAFGQDTPHLGWLARVHQTHQTPYVAVMVSCLLGVVGVLSHSFEQLANTYILGAWPFYILCVIGLFRLRRNQPTTPRPFKVPGYPVVPAAFLIAATAMLANAAIAQIRDAVLGSALVLSGIPVYYALHYRRAAPVAKSGTP